MMLPPPPPETVFAMAMEVICLIFGVAIGYTFRQGKV